jgi:hypothetical protein
VAEQTISPTAAPTAEPSALDTQNPAPRSSTALLVAAASVVSGPPPGTSGTLMAWLIGLVFVALAGSLALMTRRRRRATAGWVVGLGAAAAKTKPGTTTAVVDVTQAIADGDFVTDPCAALRWSAGCQPS